MSLVLLADAAVADRLTRFNYQRYLGVDVWSLNYTPDAGPDFTMPGAMLKAGYELSPTLAVEAHLGTAQSDEQTVFGGTTPVELRVTALGGVFGKLSWLHEQDRGWARFYALLGLSAVSVEAESQGGTASDTETSASFGVGIELFGNDRAAIALEWVRYIAKSDFAIDAPMVGIVYRF